MRTNKRHPTKPEYYPLKKLLIMGLAKEHRGPCLRLLAEIQRDCRTAPGSESNHQAWSGGYLDHISEVMHIAIHLYRTLNGLRPLPFTLADALLVLFLHDLEKPWRFAFEGEAKTLRIVQKAGMRTRQEKAAFREAKLTEYGIVLTSVQRNALTYVEGEIDDYSSTRRVMNELAAFCHLCDVTSARIWYAHPERYRPDPWPKSHECALARHKVGVQKKQEK